MATSWGIDPLKDVDGKVTIGTTADDFRQIQGGLYTPGLISGGTVTVSVSSMTYTVAGGVAAYPIVTTGVPQTVLGPVPSGTLTTTAATSGTRVDMIYAQQRTVAADGDPNIVLGIGTSLPARAVLLDAYIVGTTTTNTKAATRSVDIKYSIPYGASLGRLVNVTSTFNSVFGITQGNPTGRSTVASGLFYLPTQRLVSTQLTVALSANGAVGFDNSKYCEAAYDIFFDNIKTFTWTTMGLHQARQEINWDIDVAVQAGPHSIRVEHYKLTGPGNPRGWSSTGNPYARLMLTDIGPIA